MAILKQEKHPHEDFLAPPEATPTNMLLFAQPVLM